MMPLSPWETKAVKHSRLKYAWIPFKVVNHEMRHQKKRSLFFKNHLRFCGTFKTAAADLCSRINILDVFSVFLCHPIYKQKAFCKSLSLFTLIQFCPGSGNKNHIWTRVKKGSTAKKSGRWTIVSVRARCNAWLWSCNPNTAAWLEMKRSLNVYLVVWLKLTQRTPPIIVKEIVRKQRSFPAGGTVYHD